MVLSFTVNQAMYLAFARGQAEPLIRVLQALPEIPSDSQWANFVRNHDELTLDKLSEDERAEVFAAFGPEREYQVYGRGLRRRLPSMVGEDQDRIRLAYSLAFSLPGTPVLFYGEEIGMRESLAIPGRLSVRSPMQWSSERHRGFTTGEPFRPLAPGDAEVAAQRRDPGSLLTWMELLIRRRRECPELGWGRVTLLDARDPAVLAHRADWDESAIVAVHSLAEEPRSVRVEVGDAEAAVDLFGPDELAPRGGRIEVELGRYGHRWFRLRRPGQRVAP
jgi:maltose alpha-D-glucosyltransferase/alpha-amylase